MNPGAVAYFFKTQIYLITGQRCEWCIRIIKEVLET